MRNAPDFYQKLRPWLFRLDAEFAHRVAVLGLQTNLYPYADPVSDPSLTTRVCGLTFPNPVGLAAGFDKHAEAMRPLFKLGFGAVEVGSITPRPQDGNPKPRLFRVTEAEAVINRFGFNSHGFIPCIKRIEAFRHKGKSPGILGINIGKNKETLDAAADYTAGIAAFAPLADYLTVNVSSPNTPGLRDLQTKQHLADLLLKVIATRNATQRKPPVFVKIAPDQTEEQLQDIADVALGSGINGIIIGNTTVTRPDNIPLYLASEAGGLSGKPLFGLSTHILSSMYRLTKGRIPLIGCGGIASAADAYEKIRAGASLIQLYSALVYQGPGLVNAINKGLIDLLHGDGYTSVAQAVGADHK